MGFEAYELATTLWGINRSITGDGVRQTLNILKDIIPKLRIIEVPTGTKAYDWVVPREWNVSQAYILDPEGERICDLSENNLHLMGYSTPINAKMPLSELQNHLFSRPDFPDAIPYVTSYYEENWGFCLSENQRKNLADGIYEVVIESSLSDGSMTYGEIILPGYSEQEIFLSTYICHPSMANNELSGPCVLAKIVEWLSTLTDSKYTYRIIFIPETIGAIYYISQYLDIMKNKMVAGFNVTCIGDERDYSYVSTRTGNTIVDEITNHVFSKISKTHTKYDWLKRGSDERQYCAPGVDLPVATICRSKFHEFPEYHTSLDTLGDVVTPKGLSGGLELLKRCIEATTLISYPSASVLCEPQLSKRNLYPTISKGAKPQSTQMIKNILSLSDGKTSTLEMAVRLNCPIWDLRNSLDTLLEYNLIRIDI